MGYQLRRWLRNRLPAECTPAERLVALEIADCVSDDTRKGWPTLEELAGWSGLRNAKSVGQALRGLAEKGWELRVPIAFEKDGVPVFARVGQKVTFQIPEERSTAPAPRSVKRRTSNTAELRSVTDLEEGRGPSLNAARSVEERREVRSVTDPSPHISSTKPQSIPGPFANGPAESDSKPYGTDPTSLPEPLRTIMESLAATNPGATLEEARAILQLIAATRTPGGVRYYTAIAANGGFGAYLAEHRRVRGEQTGNQIDHLRRTEAACDHGTPAGRSPHPVHQTPLCPHCRRGAPAPVTHTTAGPPEQEAIIRAYSNSYQVAGWPFDTQLLTRVAGQIGEALRRGVPAATLTQIAASAGAAGTDILTHFEQLRSAP